MCFGGGSSTPKTAGTPQVYKADPNAVADTSNDAASARQQMVAGTNEPNTFGSELGASAPKTK